MPETNSMTSDNAISSTRIMGDSLRSRSVRLTCRRGGTDLAGGLAAEPDAFVFSQAGGANGIIVPTGWTVSRTTGAGLNWRDLLNQGGAAAPSLGLGAGFPARPSDDGETSAPDSRDSWNANRGLERFLALSRSGVPTAASVLAVGLFQGQHS